MKYSLIYADPAWEYGNTVSNGAATNHYGTMKLIDMKRLLFGTLLPTMLFWLCGSPVRTPEKLSNWLKRGVLKFAR